MRSIAATCMKVYSSLSESRDRSQRQSDSVALGRVYSTRVSIDLIKFRGRARIIYTKGILRTNDLINDVVTFASIRENSVAAAV